MYFPLLFTVGICHVMRGGLGIGDRLESKYQGTEAHCKTEEIVIFPAFVTFFFVVNIT